jgi:hypothetical protein
MENTNLTDLTPEPYQYGETQSGVKSKKLNDHLQLTRLSQSKIEITYIKSHFETLQKYMRDIEINSDNKRLINKLYKKLINLDNIIKVYSHPISIFFNALIEGDLKLLSKSSSSYFKPSIRKQL